MGKTKIMRRGEVDDVNERVSNITGMSLKFLYQGDGIHPSTRALQMNLDEFIKMQRENDAPPQLTAYKRECSCCGGLHADEIPRRVYSISQKMAMSEAWSHELRYKIQESERKNEVKVYVDPYFEDWE